MAANQRNTGSFGGLSSPLTISARTTYSWRVRFWRIGVVLVLGLVVLTSPTRTESNGGVRVLPLGDSITDGFTEPGGYRTRLWQRLSRHGVDFVGSASSGPVGLDDHDHEGHPGWRIDQLDAGIVTWVRSARPRTVLLHAGTNDLNQNHDVAAAPARLGALLDKIRSLAPLAEVFVAQITPIPGDTVLEQRVRAFNAALPAVVAQRGPRTHLVDMHSGFSAADLADGVHPTSAGYAEMADRWTAALESVPESLTPLLAPPVGVPAVLANPRSLRCLDLDRAAGCDGRASQTWMRTAAGELRAADGRCLDAAALAVRACDGSPGQHFSFSPNGSVVAESGGCLDAASRFAECRGTGDQRWSVR
jgi:lysophospholipase L1-like esterase